MRAKSLLPDKMHFQLDYTCCAGLVAIPTDISEAIHACQTKHANITYWQKSVFIL